MRLHNFSVIVLSYRLFTNLAGDDKMTNLATKPLSRDYGLVARLVILSNMLHKPDLSAARSGTIVWPITRVTTHEVSRSRETTPHHTD